jgi:hypothetical protein
MLLGCCEDVFGESEVEEYSWGEEWVDLHYALFKCFFLHV